MQRFALLAAAAALACAATVRADDNPPPAKTVNRAALQVAPGWAGMGGATGQNEAAAYIQYLAKDVELSDDQQQTITDIFAARTAALEKFNADNADKLKAAGQAVTDAFKKQDMDAAAIAQEKYQKLYEPSQKIMKKAAEDLAKVLTPAQTAQLQDARAMEIIALMTKPATLTERQIQQLKAAYRAAAKGDPEAETFAQAIDRILTFDQKSLIAKTRAEAYVKAAYASVDLTPAQQKRAAAIINEIARDPDLQAAPMQLYGALTERINELLTDQQKETLQGGGAQAKPPATKRPAE